MKTLDQPYTRIVNILIAINVLMFVLDTQIFGGINKIFALYFPRNPHFADWQFISYMFMHGGLTHLLFNMFGLWMFGTQIERALGRSRFLAFYFACGIGAAIIYTAINQIEFDQIYQRLINSGISNTELNQYIINQQALGSGMLNDLMTQLSSIFYIPMVGASGALYGVLVAYAFFFPENKLMIIFIPYPIAAKYFVPMIIALDLFSGVTGFSLFGGSVAYFAHVGGALIGFILMYIWRQRLSSR